MKTIPTPKDIFQPWGDQPEGSKQHLEWLKDQMVAYITDYLSEPQIQQHMRAHHKNGNWPAALGGMSFTRNYPKDEHITAAMPSVTEHMKQFGWLFTMGNGRLHHAQQIMFMPLEAVTVEE